MHTRKPVLQRADADSCGGVIALGTVVSCPAIDPGQQHVFKLTTTTDHEDLRVRLSVETPSGWGGDTYVRVTSADGADICSGGDEDECTAPEAGTYSVTVRRDSSSEPGPVKYRLGVQSFSNPQNCTALQDGAFTFPLKVREGTLPAASAGLCFGFGQPTGSLLRLAVSTDSSLRGQVVDAEGTTVCGLDYDTECRLTGTAPYRIVFASQWYEEGPYRFWAVRLSDPEGCAAMSPAAFGGPGDAASSLTVEGNSIGCQTVTTTAGPHLLTFGARSFEFRMHDHTGKQVCGGSDRPTAECEVPADGTYAVITNNNYSEPRTVDTAVYPLMSTKGCAGPIGTSWNTAPTRVRMTSALQVDCHLFEAEPGDRVRVDAPNGWITDASGTRLCKPVDGEEQDSCSLPGAGPYRVVSAGYWSDGSEPFEYAVSVVRLNGREGCEAVSPGRYDAAPAGPLSTNRCRVLTVPTAGTYHVALVGEDNYHAYGQVYDSTGLLVCSGSCDFPKAGAYTLVAPEAGTYATVFLGATSEGCVTASDEPLKAPVAGEFKVAGEYDCLQLPTPHGAGIALVRPQDSTGTGYPEMAVYDAKGAYQCGIDELRDYNCVLDGTAPFRAVLHLDSDTDQVAGPYRLGFARTDGTPACPVLPASAFGSSATTPVSLGGTAFVGCFSVPAGHKAAEGYAFRRTGGTGLARVAMFGADGKRVCNRSKVDAAAMICRPGAGAATLLIEGTAASGTYAFTRHDVTGTAAGCRTITDTKVGAPAIPATLASAGDMHCYKVTAPEGDRLAIDSRDPAKQTRAIVLDAVGADQGCAGLVSGCSVGGKTAYQVLVLSFAAGSTAYELDTWNVWKAGKPPAECTVVPSVAYGFGPYTGTLTTSKPAACFTTTRGMSDDMPVDVTNPVHPDDGYYWDSGIYSVTGQGMESCAIGEGGFHCGYRGQERTQTTVYLLTNGQRLEPHPYRVEAICENPLCGGNTFGVTSVSPASLVNGGKRTITLKGTSLHLRDTVQVTPAGGAALTASVKTVSRDRRTLTAEVDLTSAATGTTTVTVRAYDTDAEPVVLSDALKITRSPVRATTAPSVSGTVAVGATVKAAPGVWTPAATSYAYRWSADGVTISGATGASLPISASLLGKRLTVTVTASRSGYPSGSATSAATSAVAKGKAPAASVKPKITGTAKVGKTVKAAPGTWSPKADSYRYQWRLNGTVVQGATGSSLKLTSGMRDKKLTVTVIARRTGHADGKATSASVTVRR
ncbi:hypothetical protein [Actinoplanes sp. NPDC049681]|uniref:hypothetical protein n=1 Tax=Actinoplanes sp. NPDC049681 TaxID=3363905 RepID=UPI0037AA9DEF